ncbi:zinc-binding alcohol dehydrogenase family protein [Tropicimonas sediminicola]|uniref:Zinc-type alcohol dehydrogenase-like protein n=1 Tax=Tropicimonas sediminicola TaxID=1031541 RepID=A0A239FRR4_9RHOB|nr:zinc-binding alcohol dehydrogenase family protein [Tropicimonas sediminicola]SNS59611.1 zinc-binding alcohol dehydrogenase family protein [Tropicimonas sediminicola]
MKAVGFKTPGSLDREDALVDITLDTPVAAGRDLLVRVEAVSLNPADTKVRQDMAPPDGQWIVLGYDASGVVEAVGPDVTGFEPGDAVYYSGDVMRPGTNAEFHLVDERIVGRGPANLSHAEAAGLPLTTLAAWEALFDRLDVRTPTAEGGKLILVIGGAGGVGSIAVQLLRELTDLTIIATASRPETVDWVRDLGAHHVVNHREPMRPQIEALGLGAPGFILSTNGTAGHIGEIAQIIAPQGRFSPVDNSGPVDLTPFGMKSVAVYNFTMFTRPMFKTPDMGVQGKILSEVADLIDAGRLRTTVTEVAGRIDAANLRKAHALVESGKARGKIVLEGFRDLSQAGTAHTNRGTGVGPQR